MRGRRVRVWGLAFALASGVVLGIACQRGGEPTAPGASPLVAVPPQPAVFADVTATSGIRFTYRNGEEVTPPHLSILESLGGGGSVLDYDGDGLLDLFLTGGGYFGGKDKKQILGNPCRLYRNLGGMKFEDVTTAVGLEKLAGGAPWFYTHGTTVGDYDRDGWPDLLVTGWGRVALFRNVPDGKNGRKFEDVSAAAGLDTGITWATSAAFADLDGDGYPDLYVCQYVDWSFTNNPPCNYDGKTPDVCPPKKFKGLPGKVYRNTGQGAFVDVTTEAGLLPGGQNQSKSLGVLAADLNLDGKPDIYVANDTVANFLYLNHSEKNKIRFDEKGMIVGVALDGGGQPNGSMGVDAGDPEGNGKPAIWVTNYENEYHALYRNLSAPGRTSFLFATDAVGIAAIGQKFVGWGTSLVDFDHDGWEDVFVSNGHAIRFPTGAPRRQKPVLLMNTRGRFSDQGSRGGEYFSQPHLGRGVVFADLDNDGRIDVVLCNMNEPTAVLHNVAPAGNHWLGVELVGKGHADVVGARIIVDAGGRTQTRFAKGGGSYASSADRRAVFGLGAADTVSRLTVVWPDGSRQEWTNVKVDQYHRAVAGVKELAAPGKPSR